MKELSIIFDAAKELGYDLEDLTVGEGISLKNEIKEAIEQAIIASDNK